MLQLSKLKGIHPGKIVERELRNRNIAKNHFASLIGEYPQTLSAITRGARNMNTPLALRIEAALGLEEGFLMILQIYYDIAQEKKRRAEKNKPDLSLFRPALFWDTDLNRIDWYQQQAAVIDRVFSRGTVDEKAAIRKFYGDDLIDQHIKENQSRELPSSYKNKHR